MENRSLLNSMVNMVASFRSEGTFKTFCFLLGLDFEQEGRGYVCTVGLIFVLFLASQIKQGFCRIKEPDLSRITRFSLCPS